ncbi:hypothetical protein C8J95_102368 [Elizabethkingia sp. YR214]|nr:hypothetical protein C8J95_102368 [Elizabethkingia sp. YR214]
MNENLTLQVPNKKAPHLPKGASNHIKHKILYEKKFILVLIYKLFLFLVQVIYISDN